MKKTENEKQRKKWWSIIKKHVIRGWNWFNPRFKRHKDFISAVLVFLLIIVTTVQIITTSSSIKATESIRDVEVYLQNAKRKQEIKERIDMADNLINEMEYNRKKMIEISSSVEELKKQNKSSFIGNLYIRRLEQVRDSISFGTQKIRTDLELYYNQMMLINIHLEEIRKSTAKQDREVRMERLEAVEGEAQKIQPFDNLIRDINNYKKGQEQDLRDLDGKMQDDLLAL